MRAPDRLDAFLARFASALASLSPADREDILLETRSHVTERARQRADGSIDAVLAELGSPEEYARRFLDEAAALPPSPAPPAAARSGTLAGLARLATGPLATLPVLALVLAGYGVALLALLLVVGKLLEPRATGLDVVLEGRERHVWLAWSDPSFHVQHDVLGMAIVPLGLALAVALHLVMRAVLRRFVR